MKRNKLIITVCKHCGKQITTLIKSIYGAKEAKKKYSNICQSCITNAELYDIMKLQAEAILNQKEVL